LGLDAGSLASALSATEQAEVRAILLTHRHFDHTRDIPSLGVAMLDDTRSIDVYSLPETLTAVHAHMLNWDMYPDLTGKVTAAPPKYRFQPVQPEVPFRVLNYEVKPIPVPHAAPTVGYIVKSDAGGCMAYTGDTSGNLLPFFQDRLVPQVLFVEVTFPDHLADLAALTGHLTPGMLRDQLLAALAAGVNLPKMVAVHMDPQYQRELVGQVSALADELGVDLTPGHEGMQVVV
jgi:ribonuclease BN (tRNA processing enzyme)